MQFMCTDTVEGMIKWSSETKLFFSKIVGRTRHRIKQLNILNIPRNKKITDTLVSKINLQSSQVYQRINPLINK
jgi:hypothetical protein